MAESGSLLVVNPARLLADVQRAFEDLVGRHASNRPGVKPARRATRIVF